MYYLLTWLLYDNETILYSNDMMAIYYLYNCYNIFNLTLWILFCAITFIYSLILHTVLSKKSITFANFCYSLNTVLMSKIIE